jgi:hypothetical protein
VPVAPGQKYLQCSLMGTVYFIPSLVTVAEHICDPTWLIHLLNTASSFFFIKNIYLLRIVKRSPSR